MEEGVTGSLGQVYTNSDPGQHSLHRAHRDIQGEVSAAMQGPLLPQADRLVRIKLTISGTEHNYIKERNERREQHNTTIIPI